MSYSKSYSRLVPAVALAALSIVTLPSAPVEAGGQRAVARGGRTAAVARPGVGVGSRVVGVVPYRPYYYGYRPGLTLGFYAGYPYGYYPWGYGYYGDYYGYPVPPASYVAVAPGVAYGGVRIQGAPRDAQVFVDSYYVGIVDDFDGAFQHLNLPAGPHQVEIRPGAGAPAQFDVRVEPGQTITYHAEVAGPAR